MMNLFFTKRNYVNAEKAFTKYGYTIPKIIIWDLCSDEIEPDYYTDLGITVIKGLICIQSLQLP